MCDIHNKSIQFIKARDWFAAHYWPYCELSHARSIDKVMDESLSVQECGAQAQPETQPILLQPLVKEKDYKKKENKCIKSITK